MEETTRLIKQAHDGDPEAREQLVLKNVGLVWSIVRRFAGRGHELEDLYQIGCIGLIKAIDKFNLEFDVKFSTYAVPMITGEIKRFLRDDGMIKVSRSLKELGIRVSSVREQMTWELGREPGLDELANRVGASREEVAASIEASTEVESIDKNVGNGEDQNLRLLDKLPDQREEQEQLLNRMVLGQILNLLEEKDREIIVRRYFENQTQSQIAADLHISQVQVSRLEKKILRKMREYLNP
ncbi:MAG: SigB/SigF/SigG family RNA polymerase sigma factor [Lachnospiraceae bacterium]|nr:SigB/SigF/SigG family RNA polymerase sigma factor [Lachnospiraceae bacterium]MCI9185125.1 SigB/SigF/SigG family RNA polymerase sigma factor [Lachnospiraceae bacterium]